MFIFSDFTSSQIYHNIFLSMEMSIRLDVFFYIATFYMWINLINLPNQQIKDIKTCAAPFVEQFLL